jgi:cytosine/creatinine deaminase
VGREASFVLLQATSAVEALRLRAQRLVVVRRGRVIARMPARTAELMLPGRPTHVDFTRQAHP